MHAISRQNAFALNNIPQQRASEKPGEFPSSFDLDQMKFVTHVAINPFVATLLRWLNPHPNQVQSLIVGGFARDLLWGFAPHDIDIKTTLSQEQLKELFQNHPQVTAFHFSEKMRALNCFIGHFWIKDNSGHAHKIDFHYNIGSLFDLVNPASTHCINFVCNALALDKFGNIRSFPCVDFQAYLGTGRVHCIENPEIEFIKRPMNILNYIRMLSKQWHREDFATVEVIRRIGEEALFTLPAVEVRQKLVQGFAYGNAFRHFHLLVKMGLVNVLSSLLKQDPLASQFLVGCRAISYDEAERSFCLADEEYKQDPCRIFKYGRVFAPLFSYALHLETVASAREKETILKYRALTQKWDENKSPKEKNEWAQISPYLYPSYGIKKIVYKKFTGEKQWREVQIFFKDHFVFQGKQLVDEGAFGLLLDGEFSHPRYACHFEGRFVLHQREEGNDGPSYKLCEFLDGLEKRPVNDLKIFKQDKNETLGYYYFASGNKILKGFYYPDLDYTAGYNSIAGKFDPNASFFGEKSKIAKVIDPEEEELSLEEKTGWIAQGKVNFVNEASFQGRFRFGLPYEGVVEYHVTLFSFIPLERCLLRFDHKILEKQTKEPTRDDFYEVYQILEQKIESKNRWRNKCDLVMDAIALYLIKIGLFSFIFTYLFPYFLGKNTRSN
jgi:tRNA nucleotidyltransferase/poly(A) polymerase